MEKSFIYTQVNGVMVVVCTTDKTARVGYG